MRLTKLWVPHSFRRRRAFLRRRGKGWDRTLIGNIMDRGYGFHAGNGTAGSGTDNGNVFAITNYRDANRSQAFTYDALNRLASGASSANTGSFSWGENYSIDAWGNLQISPMGTKAHGGTFQLSGNARTVPLAWRMMLRETLCRISPPHTLTIRRIDFPPPLA
jgi:hypothetical protein